MINVPIEKQNLIHLEPVLLFKDSRAMLKERAASRSYPLPLEVFPCTSYKSAGTCECQSTNPSDIRYDSGAIA
jgi:hypothetical protein